VTSSAVPFYQVLKAPDSKKGVNIMVCKVPACGRDEAHHHLVEVAHHPIRLLEALVEILDRENQRHESEAQKVLRTAPPRRAWASHGWTSEAIEAYGKLTPRRRREQWISKLRDRQARAIACALSRKTA
jgi:hypothetical protein